jgi:hypothetical protein
MTDRPLAAQIIWQTLDDDRNGVGPNDDQGDRMAPEWAVLLDLRSAVDADPGQPLVILPDGTLTVAEPHSLCDRSECESSGAHDASDVMFRIAGAPVAPRENP